MSTPGSVHVRWLFVAALAGFLPLFWYMFVVGGVLPYGAILLITIHNLSNVGILLWNGIHLTIYGAALYWLAGLLVKLIERYARGHILLGAAIVFLILAGIGLLPIFGAAHGRVEWMNVYDLYASGKLR